MKLRLAINLNPSIVLSLVDEIDGDGRFALDAEKLKARLPEAFLKPLIEENHVSEFSQLYVDVAGPDTVLRSVWSLALLRAFMQHYGLDLETPYMGHSRNAEIYSQRLREHLKGGA
jgi:hypothetical protein